MAKIQPVTAADLNSRFLPVIGALTQGVQIAPKIAIGFDGVYQFSGQFFHGKIPSKLDPKAKKKSKCLRGCPHKTRVVILPTQTMHC